MIKHLKISSTIAALVALVFASSPVSAWGPERSTYTWEAQSPAVAINSITDNPDFGDERDFVRIREFGVDGAKFSSDDLKILPGRIYEVEIYYRNDASTSLGETSNALGLKLLSQLPATITPSAGDQKITSSITGDNLDTFLVWGDIRITTEKNLTLTPIPNSAAYYTKGSINGQQIDVDALFGESGIDLNYTNGLPGILPAGADGFVRYRFTAIETPAPVLTEDYKQQRIMDLIILGVFAVLAIPVIIAIILHQLNRRKELMAGITKPAEPRKTNVTGKKK
jgi:hypothetical protein